MGDSGIEVMCRSNGQSQDQSRVRGQQTREDKVFNTRNSVIYCICTLISTMNQHVNGLLTIMLQRQSLLSWINKTKGY